MEFPNLVIVYILEDFGGINNLINVHQFGEYLLPGYFMCLDWDMMYISWEYNGDIMGI